MKHKLYKNGVTFEIEQTADQYGYHTVWAKMGGQKQYGKIPGNLKTVYPRIEFDFCSKAQWLHKQADARSWAMDDHETGEDVQKRPTDNCKFILTADEVAFLNSWRIVPGKEPSAPAPKKGWSFISSGFGIGGHGSSDHNMSLESGGTAYDHHGCRGNNGTRYDEACASCGNVTVICNDCERCANCHGK